MRPPQLAGHGLPLRTGSAPDGSSAGGSGGQPVQAFVPVSTDPAVHHPPGHPEPLDNLHHRHPAWTSNTARYRCAVMVNSTSTRRSVTHQAEYDTDCRFCRLPILLPSQDHRPKIKIVQTFCTASRRPATGRTRRRSGTWPPLPLSLGGNQADAHRLARIARSPRGRRVTDSAEGT